MPGNLRWRVLTLGGVLAVALTGWIWLTPWRVSGTLADDATTAESGPSLSQVIGLTALEQNVGVVPTGRGIVAGHVEGGSDGAYMPHTRQERFRGVHFVPQSGPGRLSDHAHGTAKVIYGSQGLAPGIQTVLNYSSTDWLTGGFLRTGEALPPKETACRLFNHSWIAEHDPAAVAAILRRVDYVVDIQDVVMVVGVDNGPQKPVPSLLAASFNAIAVGRADGRSSGGRTRQEGEGRCKPDLTAPGGLTSFATPVVSAMVARLLESANRRDAASGVRHTEVIKAVLLAGAQKPAGWKADEQSPLDDHWGAGVIRFDQSLAILDAGGQAALPAMPEQGWWFGAAAEKAELNWELPKSAAGRTLTAVVVWHRRIDGRQFTDVSTGRSFWVDTPRLADFDLYLQQPGGQVLARSVSRVDNVEHVMLTVPEGPAQLTIRRVDALAEEWDLAIAWRLQ